MEALPKDVYLEFLPNTLEYVRKLYGLEKPGAMKDAVDILITWIEKQNHFTRRKFSRDYLERLIIANKGSVERTKYRLDRQFTIRTMMPDFFRDFDARYDFESIQNIVISIYYGCLFAPRLFSTLYNCQGARQVVTALGAAFLLRYPASHPLGVRYRHCQEGLMEYCRGYDYACSTQVVIDYSDVVFKELFAAFDMIDLRETVVALVDGYGLRVKGVHLIIKSKVIDIVMNIAKQVLSDKIKKRLHIHKTYDSLFKHLPKEIFPKDIGGEEEQLAELHAKMMKIFCTEEFREYYREMNSARTDELLRPGDTFNDQYIGMPGTFRSLSVD